MKLNLEFPDEYQRELMDVFDNAARYCLNMAGTHHRKKGNPLSARWLELRLILMEARDWVAQP